MLMARMPIAVVMQRRIVNHVWADTVWSAIDVLPHCSSPSPVEILSKSEAHESYLVSGLYLELHSDENEGYFENWAAPEPKVFVMWHMREQRAMPVCISLSYMEGTRMFDSGESADGIFMRPEIHSWLSDYLRINYRPREQRRKHHG